MENLRIRSIYQAIELAQGLRTPPTSFLPFTEVDLLYIIVSAMTSPQHVDLSEYYSFLTYYGILPTGMLSESDLDYLVFRLKIFSTSLNADSAPHSHTPPLFELNATERTPTNSDNLVSQPHSTTSQTYTDADTCFDEWPAANLSDPLKVHMCDFYDELSPCWNRRCELWEGITDGQSWMWGENNILPDNMTKKHHDIVEGSQIDVEGSVPQIDQTESFVRGLPVEQLDH